MLFTEHYWGGQAKVHAMSMDKRGHEYTGLCNSDQNYIVTNMIIDENGS
jgi:hypothetical protein